MDASREATNSRLFSVEVLVQNVTVFFVLLCCFQDLLPELWLPATAAAARQQAAANMTATVAAL